MIRDFTASYIHLFMAGLQPEAQAWHSPSVINIPVTEYSACHNDLLADNFILINADALHKHASPMYIIDWEYAGMAPRYYDIGDMFQEILVPREAEKRIVREYCEDKDFDNTLYLVDLFKPFPDIYWFLWSLIQLNVSKIAFDYYSYGKIKYENALQNIEFIHEWGRPLKGVSTEKTPLLKEKYDSFSFDTSYDSITKTLFLFRSAPATSNNDSRGL